MLPLRTFALMRFVVDILEAFFDGLDHMHRIGLVAHVHRDAQHTLGCARGVDLVLSEKFGLLFPETSHVGVRIEELIHCVKVPIGLADVWVGVKDNRRHLVDQQLCNGPSKALRTREPWGECRRGPREGTS